MTNGNDGAYARAGSWLTSEDGDPGEQGLTKRELFAAMAMQGMFTNELLSGSEENANIAKDAVSAADALIEALNKPEAA